MNTVTPRQTPLPTVKLSARAEAPVIITCRLAPVADARVSTAVRGRAEVYAAADFEDAREAIERRNGRVSALIVAADEDTSIHAVSFVRAVASTWPYLPIVAYCEPGFKSSPRIRALTSAGIHEFLFRGVDEEGSALRSIIEGASQECAGRAVMRFLRPVLPARLQDFAELAVSHPAKATTLPAMTEMLGTTRQTLHTCCTEGKVPPPSELLSWCRLALVAHLLEQTARTVESIAAEMEYPSGTSLRNNIKRYLGLRASDLRAAGSTERVVEAFKAASPAGRTIWAAG